MPHFSGFPYPRRYNTLRLLGYGYESVFQLCAITMVTDLRRPLFADMKLAKSVLASLLSDQTLTLMRVRAFSLMPDHLHLLAGVRQAKVNLPTLLGRLESYTTQLYWKRSREIVESQQVCLPPTSVARTNRNEARLWLAPLIEWRATLRPEMVELKNWPSLKPDQFLRKRLWQTKFFDHIIRNDDDLHENLEYIAMNPVKAGYVKRDRSFILTPGFLCRNDFNRALSRCSCWIDRRKRHSVLAPLFEESNLSRGPVATLVATECHPYIQAERHFHTTGIPNRSREQCSRWQHSGPEA